MLHTYAIEPDALATWDKCRHLLDLMGFQHGRAIAAYPTRKRWRALVRAACRANAGVGDRDRRRILRRLDQSLDLSNAKLVRLDGAVDYDDAIAPAEECWIRNTVAHQRSARAFHAILATRNPDDHSDVVLEEDVDASHAKLDVPREVPVLREPAALAAHVGTLVRNSPRASIDRSAFRPVGPQVASRGGGVHRTRVTDGTRAPNGRDSHAGRGQEAEPGRVSAAVPETHSEHDVRQGGVDSGLPLADSRRRFPRFPRPVPADGSRRLQARQGTRCGPTPSAVGRPPSVPSSSRRLPCKPRYSGRSHAPVCLSSTPSRWTNPASCTDFTENTDRCRGGAEPARIRPRMLRPPSLSGIRRSVCCRRLLILLRSRSKLLRNESLTPDPQEP